MSTHEETKMMHEIKTQLSDYITKKDEKKSKFQQNNTVVMDESKIIKRKPKDEKECAICCNKIKKQNDMTITKCGHYFHSRCMFKSLVKSGQHCPICRTHLFKRELTMQELFEECKDKIFNFDTFCYIMNMSEIPTNDLSCIKDYGLYEDDYDSDDEDDDKLFSIQKYEHNFYHTINDILENEKETTL